MADTKKACDQDTLKRIRKKKKTHTVEKMLYLMNDHRWKGQNVNWWDMYSGQWSCVDWPMVVFGSWSFVFNNPFTTCVCTSFPLTIFYSLLFTLRSFSVRSSFFFFGFGFVHLTIHQESCDKCKHSSQHKNHLSWSLILAVFPFIF